MNPVSPSGPSLPGWPQFGAEEIEAVTRVLRSGKVNYWTGTVAREFEEQYATSLGVSHAVALHNGTVALELALHALGVGPGDEVVTSARTFIASASSVVMRGAVPVFADVDAVSQNMTAATIEAVVTPRTKAIIAVHLAGWPCDMDPIMDLARERGLLVVEDCAQAHGAFYKGRPVGSIGDAGAFSFCQDKIITTGGEGGLLALNDDAAWGRAWAYKDHGKDYDAVYHRKHPAGYRWVHESFGTNWRMLETQAAIGKVQLARLPEWTRQRQANAAVLTERFRRHRALRLTPPTPDISHAYYKYYAFVRSDELAPGWTRDRVMAAISDMGVPCQAGSCSEIYLERAFRNAGYGPSSRLPVAADLGRSSLMFQVHPTLGPENMHSVADVVDEVMDVAQSGGLGS